MGYFAFVFLVMKSKSGHLVGVQVRVFLAQSEQERFGVSAQGLFGGDEVCPSDVQADPAGARFIHRLGRGARVALHRESEHGAAAAGA